MTPLQIEIILHYHYSTGDYRDGDFSATAVKDALDYFVREYFLETFANKGQPLYRILQRGEVYVAALQAVPMPVFCPGKWVMP